MGDNRGQTIFLSVIGVATLLVAIIGATFAYFTTTMSGTPQDVNFTTAQLPDVEFTAQGINETEKIFPGWNSGDKEVSVVASGSANIGVDYTCRLVITKNEVTTENLVLTVTGDSDNPAGNLLVSPKTLSGTDPITLASGTIETGQTKKFTYKVEFKETYQPQPDDEGKSFEAKVSCGLDANGSTTLYYNNDNKAPSNGTASAPTQPGA